MLALIVAVLLPVGNAAHFELPDEPVSVGDLVTVRAQDLQAGSRMLIAMTDPEGEVRLDEHAVGREGQASYPFNPRRPGTYRVDVRVRNAQGQDVQETFFVEVEAPRIPDMSLPTPEGLEEVERPETAEISFSLEERTVTAQLADEEVWQLTFPTGSGETRAVLEHRDAVYVGHGNSVLELDPVGGAVRRRWLVSGQVMDLEVAEGMIHIQVQHADGLEEAFRLQGGEIQETVRFGVDEEVLRWLEREADVVDLAARLQQDATNPWLHLNVGIERFHAGAEEEAETHFVAALDAASSFYDLARLSRHFFAYDQQLLAEEGLERALRDFAARHYYPRLLISRAASEAYGFPLHVLEEALEAGDLAGARFWAEWVWTASPDVAGAREALHRYALAQEAAGNMREAERWQQRADSGVAVAGGVELFVTHLAGSGWYAAMAVLLAIAGFHLTLIAKYWLPQSEDLQGSQNVARKLLRVFEIRYYTLTEKTVLILLCLSVIVLALLADWHQRGYDLSPALGSGTLASEVARETLQDVPTNTPHGAFLHGFAAHSQGDSSRAEAHYREAGEHPPALNNLGVLVADERYTERALELMPSMQEARFNLGAVPQGQSVRFQRRYAERDRVLYVPSRIDLQEARGQGWGGALMQGMLNPWRALRGADPPGLSPFLWRVLLGVFVAGFLLTVIFLFVPRPRSAQDAPRSTAYQVFALLIPGSGLADEVWGVLLTLPWAIFGVATLTANVPGALSTGLEAGGNAAILAIIYVINFVAVIYEYFAYNRGIKQKRRQAREDKLQAQRAAKIARLTRRKQRKKKGDDDAGELGEAEGG